MKAKRKPAPKAREPKGPEIGHRLRDTRLVLGITEREAAEAARSTVRTWRKWEIHGCLMMGPLLHLADKYDVNLDWLISGDGGAVRSHLAQHAPGKIAILPAAGPNSRRARETFAAHGWDRDSWDRGA